MLGLNLVHRVIISYIGLGLKLGDGLGLGLGFQLITLVRLNFVHVFLLYFSVCIVSELSTSATFVS